MCVCVCVWQHRSSADGWFRGTATIRRSEECSCRRIPIGEERPLRPPAHREPRSRQTTPADGVGPAGRPTLRSRPDRPPRPSTTSTASRSPRPWWCTSGAEARFADRVRGRRRPRTGRTVSASDSGPLVHLGVPRFRGWALGSLGSHACQPHSRGARVLDLVRLYVPLSLSHVHGRDPSPSTDVP